MLRCVIVDDEYKSRESLKVILENFCDGIEVVAACQDGTEAAEAFRTYKPDVVFLDIQLQRETGFQILERLDSIDFDIIFTSAYSEFAAKASTFSAIDYLLKPIDIADLNAAVEKVRAKRPA